MALCRIDPETRKDCINFITSVNALLRTVPSLSKAVSDLIGVVINGIFEYIKSICLPQMKVVNDGGTSSSSVDFLASQLGKIRNVMQNMQLFLPFINAEEVLPRVWDVFRTQIVDPSARIVTTTKV